PERDVCVRRLAILAVEQERVEVELEVSKGFYVRSFARDLARALDTRGYLAGLRRLRSGPFGLERAVNSSTLAAAKTDEDAARQVREALLDLPRACAGMPRVILSGEGVEHARHGRPID